MFSSQEEAAERFIRTSLAGPEAYRDTLESGGLQASQTLREGKHLLIPFKIEVIGEAALRVEADSLILRSRTRTHHAVTETAKRLNLGHAHALKAASNVVVAEAQVLAAGAGSSEPSKPLVHVSRPG